MKERVYAWLQEAACPKTPGGHVLEVVVVVFVCVCVWVGVGGGGAGEAPVSRLFASSFRHLRLSHASASYPCCLSFPWPWPQLLQALGFSVARSFLNPPGSRAQLLELNTLSWCQQRT